MSLRVDPRAGLIEELAHKQEGLVYATPLIEFVYGYFDVSAMLGDAG